MALPITIALYSPIFSGAPGVEVTLEDTPEFGPEFTKVTTNVYPEEEAEPATRKTPPKPKPPNTYEYEATFYVATCEGCSGITATGYDVRQTQYYEGYRIIAADDSVPFGTIMRITLEDGTEFDGIVADRGGAIGKLKLDILVASKAEAYRLGRQRARVEILN